MYKKLIIAALLIIAPFAAHAALLGPGPGILTPGLWVPNSASSTITPNPNTLQVPCANIVGGCSGSSGGGSGVVGGSATSTIYGTPSSSYIANFNQKYQFPSPPDLANVGCMGNRSVTDWVGCLHYIYTIASGSMEIDAGGYNYPFDNASTSFNIANKYILITGVAGGGTVFNSSFTTSGQCALTFNIGNAKQNGWGFDGVYINGPNSGASIGTCWGGTQGAEGGGFHNSLITHFYQNILVGDNTYLWYFVQSTSNFNFTNNSGGGLIWVNGSTNTGETIECDNCLLADGQPAAKAIEVQTSGETNVAFVGGSSDDAQALINQYGGQGNNVLFDNWHAEDPATHNGSIPPYDYFVMSSNNPFANDSLSIVNSTIQGDEGATSEGNIVDLNGHLVLSNDSINNNGSNGFGVFPLVVNFYTTSSTIYSSGITQNTNQYNGIAATYLYNTVPLVGGVQTYNVTSTFGGNLELLNFLSQNCLGTDASGNIVPGTCGGGGVQTSTLYTTGFLPKISSSSSLTNSLIFQNDVASTTILTPSSTISPDNTGNSFTSSVTSSTFSFTTAGTNRILFVDVVGDITNDKITGVTYNGASMTLVGKVNTPGDRWKYLFSLENPASGTHNITVSASGATNIAVAAASYDGAAQTGQPEATSMNTATATTTITTSLTTLSQNDWVILGIDGPNPATFASGTIRLNNGAQEIADSSGTVPLGSYSAKLSGASNGWGVVMAAFAPAPAVTTTTVSSYLDLNTQTGSSTVNVSGTLAVTGAGTFGGPLNVTSTSNLVGAVSIGGATTVASTLNASSTISQSGVPDATVPPQVVTGYAPPTAFWSSTTNVGTTTIAITAIQIPYTVTLTGIGFATWDVASGSSTVGIYSYGGLLLASSTPANLSGTFTTITRPFQNTYVASPGVYYIAHLDSKGGDHFVGCVSFAKSMTVFSGTGLPTSITTSSLSGNGIIPCMATY